MKTFWEKVQDSVAKQIVAGLAAALSILAYKIIPPTTRRSLVQKLNELSELLPPVVYLLVLLIVAGVLGWVAYDLGKKNRMLRGRLRSLRNKPTFQGPAEFVDVGHQKIFIRATYPVGIDIRAHTEQISTTPFCKEHRIELRELPHEYSSFGVPADYACDACDGSVEFKAAEVKKLEVLAKSTLAKNWRPPEPEPEIAGNIFG